MQNAVEVSNLTKDLKDFTLKNVSFTLPAGCILGLVGENGAGKTTLIKLLLGMLKSNEGSIKLMGKSHTSLQNEEIGVVFDDCCLPESFNSQDLNRMFKSIYKRWDEKAFFGYIEQFNIPQSKKIKEFSKGMKVKVSIACALSHNARLLILDEPTSGLDPVVRDEILDIFCDFTRNEENSVLISSHIVSDLEKLCDYIAFIHDGKLVLFEEKDQLIDEYTTIYTDEKELEGYDKKDVLGVRRTDYSVTAIVKKSACTSDNQSPVTLEDLFVYMIKGVK